MSTRIVTIVGGEDPGPSERGAWQPLHRSFAQSFVSVFIELMQLLYHNM